MKHCFFCFFGLLIGATFFISASSEVLDVQENSLLKNAWEKYSQSGEEGVLEAMLSRMGINQGFFVEFGAYDGVFLSNTRFLAERGWRGAFIECDPNITNALHENCKNVPTVICIDEFVSDSSSSSKGRSLDEIADQYFPSEEIDVLSLDVDGSDYLIFESLQRKPKIICIESSGYWHPLLQTRVPEEIAKKNYGQPLAVMIEIAKNHGYEPVCYLTVNLFLVRKDFYPLFAAIQNDPVTLWFDSWHYMGKKHPDDQKYIYQVRATEPGLRAYDTFPTPPLSN